MDLSNILLFLLGVYVGQEYTDIPNIKNKTIEIYKVYLYLKENSLIKKNSK